jgi:probable HAF family extracellular repeat protein
MEQPLVSECGMMRGMTRWAPLTSRRFLGFGVALPMLLAVNAAEGQTFTRLSNENVPQAFSRDGTTLTGFRIIDGRARAFAWNADDGFNLFGTTPAFGTGSSAQAVGDDGRYISGERVVGGARRVYRYDTLTGDSLTLGSFADAPTSTVSGISADGNVVVGYGSTPFDNYRAFYWTPQGGFRAIPGLNGAAQALGVSSDGSRIVGVQLGSSASEAFVWSQSQGTQVLEKLAFDQATTAYAVNGAGTLSVGTASYVANDNLISYDAIVWQGTEILRRIPIIEGYRRAYAYSLSEDGSVITGVADRLGAQVAFVWTEATGTVTMRDYLESFGVIVPDDFVFRDRVSVSADGRTFASTSGRAFIATIPSPSGASLLALLGLLASRRR